MPAAIRTIGPLHLEDLEPHRFEDLIRQLGYDFRPWVSIEPLGRTGADEGYDARAYERIEAQASDENEDGDNNEDRDQPLASRLWLIQCKREKKITPKKLAEYLAGLPQNKDEPIYGMIFAAACDFSKAARDLFRIKTRELGFSEAYLWGKGEIEDQLFQPKNDHLLFAYCGFSLQVRVGNLRTEVRSRLSTKTKAVKLLSDHRPVLVRDASDDRYPYLDPDETLLRIKRGRWKIFEHGECKWDGVHLKFRHEFAFIDKDNIHWDRAEKMNLAIANEDPWSDQTVLDELEEARREAWDIWDRFELEEKAYFDVFVVLPYEAILGFDEKGDDVFPEGIHIYTAPWVNDSPFRDYGVTILQSVEHYPHRYCRADDVTRVEKFPREPDEL